MNRALEEVDLTLDLPNAFCGQSIDRFTKKVDLDKKSTRLNRNVLIRDVDVLTVS